MPDQGWVFFLLLLLPSSSVETLLAHACCVCDVIVFRQVYTKAGQQPEQNRFKSLRFYENIGLV